MASYADAVAQKPASTGPPPVIKDLPVKNPGAKDQSRKVNATTIPVQPPPGAATHPTTLSPNAQTFIPGAGLTRQNHPPRNEPGKEATMKMEEQITQFAKERLSSLSITVDKMAAGGSTEYIPPQRRPGYAAMVSDNGNLPHPLPEVVDPAYRFQTGMGALFTNFSDISDSGIALINGSRRFFIVDIDVLPSLAKGIYDAAGYVNELHPRKLQDYRDDELAKIVSLNSYASEYLSRKRSQAVPQSMTLQQPAASQQRNCNQDVYHSFDGSETSYTERECPGARMRGGLPKGFFWKTVHRRLFQYQDSAVGVLLVGQRYILSFLVWSDPERALEAFPEDATRNSMIRWAEDCSVKALHSWRVLLTGDDWNEPKSVNPADLGITNYPNYDYQQLESNLRKCAQMLRDAGCRINVDRSVSKMTEAMMRKGRPETEYSKPDYANFTGKNFDARNRKLGYPTRRGSHAGNCEGEDARMMLLRLTKDIDYLKTHLDQGNQRRSRSRTRDTSRQRSSSADPGLGMQQRYFPQQNRRRPRY